MTPASHDTASHPGPPQPTALLISVLALLSAVAPLAIDMYLPAFPEMATDLGTTATGVQFTLTAFMIGMASGQLVIGPISDSVGRRRPLLVGTALCLVASIACALAPNIAVLIIARFVQGFTGAAGVVIARAVITDTSRGATTAKLMSVMMIIGGIMPVLAPLAGGAMLEFVDWRGVFGLISALVALMFLGVVVVVRESLPPSLRRSGGLRVLASNTRHVLGNRTYVCATLVFGMAFGAMFSYISASPFVLQNVVGLSTLQYSVVFGVNSLGIMIASMIAIRLADRVDIRRTAGAGLLLLLVATVGLLITVVLGSALVPVLVLMFAVTFSMGLLLGNVSAIAMQAAASTAGTGSAFMGAFQFLVAAVVSPLVGLAGEADAHPMAISMVICAALALIAYLGVIRATPDSANDPAVSDA